MGREKPTRTLGDQSGATAIEYGLTAAPIPVPRGFPCSPRARRPARFVRHGVPGPPSLARRPRLPPKHP